MKAALLAAWIAFAAICPLHCVTSEVGLALIRTFEGYSPYRYKDAAGLWTIGYGHLIRPGESFTGPLLPEAANQLLQKDVRASEGAIKRRVLVKLQQSQFDALVSFTFNVGEGRLTGSTLLKRVNAGLHDAVPDQLARWVYAGGKKLRGLVARRKAEGELYHSSGNLIY